MKKTMKTTFGDYIDAFMTLLIISAGLFATRIGDTEMRIS